MEGNDGQTYSRFDGLIARHELLIERLCAYHALGDPHLCAELQQECYMSLWRYLPRLSENAGPFREEAWVIWHCRSVFSHRRYRHKKVLPTVPLKEGMTEMMPTDSEDEQNIYIGTLAAQLSPDEREFFRLMADGHSAEELAKMLGIKQRSAVMKKHRIIKKLRKYCKENQIKSRKDLLR